MPDGSIKKIFQFTGAKIDMAQSGLVIPEPEIYPLLNHKMGPGVYHGYDYDFFYENLKKNVASRCGAWFKN
ncbi:MAG: hypothetical protein HUK40_08220 [Desulfobacter sp.]|nr:hypothetical protein [Desulfobacter sp.]WDP84305.1 MAG: hypothetical protein HUN05_03315 [Desulfobacter sp.]